MHRRTITQPISFYTTDDMRDAIYSLAENREISVSQVLREIIQSYLNYRGKQPAHQQLQK